MVAEVSPTIRGRELGLRLRSLRNRRGLTVEDVAAKLMCSTAKISRLETGARKPVLRDVRDLCGIYEVDKAVTAELLGLAEEARKPAWWTELDLGLDPYIGLEQSASSITAYSLLYPHGLVQTEDYARTIIRAVAPKIDARILQQRVAARMRRQELLDRGSPPGFRLLLDEAALRRLVGGIEVMAAQTAKILAMATEGKVTVQVIPFDVGAYSVADISFTLLEFDDLQLSPEVFAEGLADSKYYDRPADIARYRESLERVRDSALSPRDSLSRLADLQKTYASGRSPLV